MLPRLGRIKTGISPYFPSGELMSPSAVAFAKSPSPRQGLVRGQSRNGATPNVRSLTGQHFSKMPEKSAGLSTFSFPFRIWFDGDAV